MPDQNSPAPTFARDYYNNAVETRYGYYASVLRPGMTRTEFRNAVVNIQSTNGFVANLNDAEISNFYDNYEVVASTSQHADAAATGLDALILRSRSSQRLLVSFGGVGPFENLAGVGEALGLANEMSAFGFPLHELLAFKSFADPVFSQYGSDVISIAGHSKGGTLATALYGDLLLRGLGGRVDLVFALSPVGFDVNSLNLRSLLNSLSLNPNGELDYALSLVEALRTGDAAKIVSFGAENDPLAGPGSLTDALPLLGLTYFGFYRELVSDLSQGDIPHNAGEASLLLLRGFNNQQPLFTPRPPLIAQLRESAGVNDDDNVIVVIGRRPNSTNSTVRIVDPRTGVRLPIGLRPPTGGEQATANSAIDSKTGRVVEFEIETNDGVDVVKNRTIYDAVDPATGKPKVAVFQETDASGRPISTNVRIAGNPIGIEFSDIGSALGQQLGFRLAGDNVVAGIGASALLKTVGDNLGDALDGIIGQQSPTQAVEDAFSTFGPELLANLKAAGIGALSSLLTAELVQALGVGGFPGEALNTAAGAAVGQILTNISSGKAIFDGVNLALVGNAVGSFLGTKLASEIVNFDTIGGQIGAAVGSSVASAGLALLFAEKFTVLGGFAGPLGAFAGAFLGFIVGGLIGSIFGGTPRSGADAVWNEDEGQFVVANAYSRKGGSREAAEGMAGLAAETFNMVLSASGARIADPSAVAAGNYGTRKSDFVYRSSSTTDTVAISYRVSSSDPNAFEKLTNYGIFKGLTDPDFRLIGGDVFVKRAIYATIGSFTSSASDFDTTVLFGNIASAEAYRTYLSNPAVIGSLVAADDVGTLSGEAALTLTRAIELGLNKRHESDWFGGFGALMADTATNAGQIRFNFEYDSSNRQISRAISLNGRVLADPIDIAGQVIIEASVGNDLIELKGINTNRSGFAIYGGASELVNAAGMTINGEAADQSSVVIDVAATISTGDGNDTVLGGDLGNNIFGGAGDDALFGGRLDDWLLGDEGNDILDAGSRAGGLGGDGNFLDGGDGNDQLFGREGSDWLEGGSGVDILRAGSGGDVLSGGAGQNDELYGGAGDDTYLIRRGDGADIADDLDASSPTAPAISNPGSFPGVNLSDPIAARFAAIRSGSLRRDWLGTTAAVSAGRTAGGEDTIAFGYGVSLSDVRLSRSSDGKNLIVEITETGANGAEVLTGDKLTVRDWFTDTFKRVEWLKFIDGTEIRIGDVTSFIIGSGGNDVLIGTAGNDFVYGGAGNDKLYTLAGNDIGLGGTGDDLVSGGADNDIVVGGLGNDDVIGGSGNDAVSGDAGDDRLYGSQGKDILSGGRGDDVIAGGAGDDTFRYSRGDGNDVVFDDYSDTWTIVWKAGAWLNGHTYNAATSEVIAADGSYIRKNFGTVEQPDLRWVGQFDYDDTTGELRRFTPPANAATTVSDKGEDRIEFALNIDVQDLMFERVAGTDDLRVIVGNENAETTLASARDSLTLKDWYDNPGAIETFAFFGAGEINVAAGGYNLVAGTDGAEGLADAPLRGTTGKDWMTGAGGDDQLAGGAGDDIVAGNAGSDYLRGEAGNDVLYGGGGNDVLDGGLGGDILSGGAGIDAASYASSANAVTVYLTNTALNQGDSAGDTYDSIEDLVGSGAGDVLGGDDGDNEITGGKGSDFLLGGLGNDTYRWNIGDGADVVEDIAFEAETIVSASGEIDPDYRVEWTQIGLPKGSNQKTEFSLKLVHAQTGELIYSDRVFTYNGANTQPAVRTWAKQGWQKGFLPATDGSVTRVRYDAQIQAGDADAIELGVGISLSDLILEREANNLRISYLTPGSSNGDGLAVGQSNGANLLIRDHFLANNRVEFLIFADGLSVSLANVLTADSSGVVNGTDLDEILVGQRGVRTDVLTGGGGNDVLSGGEGNDTLRGGAGDDVLEGGSGADILDGGINSAIPTNGASTGGIRGDIARYASSTAGVTVDLASSGPQIGGDAQGDTLNGIENVTGSTFDDVLRGDENANVLDGLAGNNTLIGRGGNDVLIAGAGNDTLDGGAGEDNLSGGGGNDILRGGADKDLLAGLDGDDQLFGDEGDDVLAAGAGNDGLDGGIGDDQLIAGAGNDTLLGGGGSDTLSGEEGNDSLAGGADADTYSLAAGFGQDVLIDSEGANEIVVDQSIAYDALWFNRSGNDLVMTVRGSTDRLTISGFYATSGGASIYSIQTATHRLFLGHPDVRNFLDAMQVSAPSGAPAAMPATVAALMSRYWHEGTTARPYAIDFDLGISEDATTGAIAISAIDHDENIARYEISGAARFGTATVDAAGRFAYAPDLNFNGADSFRVVIVDADNNAREIEVRVGVAAVDDAPVIDGVEGGTLAIDEQALRSATATGNVVGRMLASEFDGEAVVFTLTDTADGRFAISADGVVSVADAARLSHESAEAHTITVRVTDAVGSFDVRSFTIAIGDVNEETVLPAAYGWTVAENTAVGSVVGQVTATDPDTAGEAFAAQRYAFAYDGALHGVSADGRYAIDASTGVVTVAGVGDFEAAQPVRDYVVVARDNAGQAGFTESRTTITIGITDVNEANSFVDSSAAFDLAENEASGKLVGTVHAADQDTPGTAFASQRYYFWDGVNASATSGDGRFAIDARTGAITATASLDFESDVRQATYTVVARDNAGEAPFFSALQNVAISLTNVNETPAVPMLLSATPLLGEALAASTVVARFGLTDPDGTTPVLVADGNPGNLFTIVGNELRLAAEIDFETLAGYGYAIGDQDGDGRADITVSLALHASDGALRSADASALTFHVEDANEAPIALLTTGLATSFAERDRLPVGTTRPAITLALLAVSDPDLAGQSNASYTYAIDDTRFEIVGNQLRLREGTAFDYEAQSQVMVNVTATDMSVDPLSITRVLTFAIENRDDYLEGTPLADTLVGQANRDVITGSSGDDRIEGLSGDDMLSGDDGADTILGGGGADRILGGADDDLLFGEDSSDTISAGAGHDTISGGAGADTIDAGEGDDRILGDNDNAADTIDGGAGTDRLVYNALDRGISANLAGGIADGDAVAHIEEIEGSAFADSLTGDHQDNRLIGGAGADVLAGLGGSDRLEAGSGDDSLTGGDGDDLLYGDAGNDALAGDAGSDILFGGDGGDILSGGIGDDRLEGGRGDDTLDAGDGNDTYIVDRRSDHDTIFNYDQSGADIDVLGFNDAFGAITEHDLWFERQGDDLVVFIIGEDSSVRVTDWYVQVDAEGRANHRLDFFLGGEWVSREADVERLAEFQSNFTRPTSSAELSALIADPVYNATVATFYGINAPPEITGIADQRILEDGRMELVLNLADDYTPAAGIAVTGVVVSGSELLGPQGLVVGSVGADGRVTVVLEPKQHASGVLQVSFTARDAGDVESTRALTLTIDPVADTPLVTHLSSTPATSGAAIALSLAVEFPDRDGSEAQSIRIAGVPAGVTLSKGVFDAGRGDWTLAPADLVGLAILAPAGWSQDLSLTVTAYAEEGGTRAQSTTATRTIVINAPPTDIVSGLSVAENAANGSAIGHLQGIDPDGDALAYQLIDGADGRFALDPDGLLRVADGAKLNFEDSTGHTIRVRISDPFGESIERWLSVGVTNMNEANTLAPTHSFAVDENRAVGSVVGSVAASDLDASGTPYAVQRYAFRSGSTLSQVSSDGLFAIDALTGAISIAAALDHEVKSAGSYTVVARDNAGGAGANETATTVAIAIDDVNEANSLAASIALSVAENQGIGASVGFVAANDQDAAGEAFGDQRYFFLVDGAASSTSADGRFAINATSGEITTARDLDRESADVSTSHTVIARDNRGTGGFNQAQTTVTIGVSNVNEAPVISGDTSRVIFAEPVPGGTVVASFAFSDPDGTAPSLQLVSGTDLFIVSGSDVVLRSGMPASYADALAYANARGIAAGDVDGDGRADVKLGTVEVVAGDGTLQSGVLRRDVYVENVAQAPNAPVVQTSNLYRETGAGLTPHAGQVVATFSLTDPDGSTPALVITGGNDNGWFQVAGNSIVFAPNIDLTAEYLRSILGTSGVSSAFAGDIDADGLKELLVANLTVAARDNDGQWSPETALAVRIEDRNEGPRFAGNLYEYGLAETVSAYTQVGAVSATDPDGPAGELTFGFAGGTMRYDGHLGASVGVSADGRLLVHARTGQVFTASGSAFTSTGGQIFDYALSVTDRNGDAHSLAAGATLRIGVSAVNEAHTLRDASGSQDEVSDLEPFTQIFDLRALMLTDPEGRNMRWQFADGTNENGIWLLTSDGKLTLKEGSVDYEALITYYEEVEDYSNPYEPTTRIIELKDPSRAIQALQIQAIDDSLGLVTNATFTATINDVNEGAVLTSNPQYYVVDDQGEGRFGQTLTAYDPDTGSRAISFAIDQSSVVKIESKLERGDSSDVDNDGHPTVSISNGNRLSFSVPGDGEWEGGIRNHPTLGGRWYYQLDYSFDLLMTDPSGLTSRKKVNVTFLKHGVQSAPPIVFDLDGDGLELISLDASNIRFDMDRDGIADRTGWVAADDGLLALDRNGNGSIDDVSEISFLGDVDGAQSDLEGLAAFDSNGNGRLDAGDRRFFEFRVWRDLNQNGVSEAEELLSLPQAGISSVDLVSTGGAAGVEGPDNFVVGTVAYQRTNGSAGIAGDVFLAFEGSAEVELAAPVLLDFDLDGETLVGLDKSKTTFDQNGDGKRERTAWFERGDAVLAVDRNKNGLIDDISEISFLSDVEGAKTDLEGLAAYDSDKNGVIDSDDLDYAALKLWFDRDSDGVSDAGEVVSLSEAKIASISLEATTDATTGKQADGSIIFGKATFRFDDGRSGNLLDTGLAYLASNSTHTTAIAGATADDADFAPASVPVDQKAKKYLVYAAGGELSLSLRKPKGNQDMRSGVAGAAVEWRFSDRSYGYLDVIVLDLDRDGLEFKNFNKNQALFDMNGDGVADDTGWTTSRDGMLVVDRNKDGRVNDGSELSFQLDAPDARSAMQGLASFDSNSDGLISILDERFSELKVWVDDDHNGVSGAGELRSLAEHGIVSISLRASGYEDRQSLGSNVLLSTAVFNRTNGASGTLGDVAFGYVPSKQPANVAATGSLMGSDRRVWEGAPRFRDLSPEDVLRDDIWARFDGDGAIAPMARSVVSMAAGALASNVTDSSGTSPTGRVVDAMTNGLAPAEAARARTLALLLQDMAAFGGDSMLDDQLRDRRHSHAIPEFFA